MEENVTILDPIYQEDIDCLMISDLRNEGYEVQIREFQMHKRAVIYCWKPEGFRPGIPQNLTVGSALGWISDKYGHVGIDIEMAYEMHNGECIVVIGPCGEY